MKDFVLIPNVSLGTFILKDKIDNYSSYDWEITHFDEGEEELIFDSYDINVYGISLWVRHGIIDSIKCEKYCYWRGKNLIRMPFEDFLVEFGLEKPKKKDIIYLFSTPKRGKNHEVYDIDGYGLQIWVWKEKILSVIMGNERNAVEQDIEEITRREYMNWKLTFENNNIVLKKIRIKKKCKQESYFSCLELLFVVQEKYKQKFLYTIYDNYKQVLKENECVKFINKEFANILHGLSTSLSERKNTRINQKQFGL